MKNKYFLHMIVFLLIFILTACNGTQPEQTSYAPAIAMTPAQAEPGTTITLIGAGFPTATEVNIFIAVAGQDFPQQPITSAVTDEKGQLKVTFTAPAGDQNASVKFAVFAQTADKKAFATNWLTIEPQQAVVNLPTTVPETTPAPEVDSDNTTACPISDNEVKVGQVVSETLNVRFGPGTNHQVVTTLTTGDQVILIGRNADNSWVEVTLADCRGGWVYGVYLKTTADLAALPFTAGAGGPVSENPSGAPATGSGVWVSIEDNVAYVTVKGMPANQNITLSLKANGKSLPQFINATTDNAGTANLKFTMPRQWSDGSTITETNLWLIATTGDGTSKETEVIYYR